MSQILVYAADLLRRNRELEYTAGKAMRDRCAKEMEDAAAECRSEGDMKFAMFADDCAKCIRALPVPGDQVKPRKRNQ